MSGMTFMPPVDSATQKAKSFDRRYEMATSLDDLVGETPTLLLPYSGFGAQVAVKLEYFNPGGSAKDRPAFEMVKAAERDEILGPESVIVESTAGNTGAGLALAAAQRGYRCVFVMPDKISLERQNLLRALGAEVVVAPHNVAPEDPRSYYSVTDRLVKEIPGAVKLDQYRNQNNPIAHEISTGPELWRQTQGRITHLVAAVGTGGTICGTARYLRAQNPNLFVLGVEPDGSVFQGDEARPYLVEGFGEDFWPDNVDASLIDRFFTVSDAQCFAAARRAARKLGLLVGGSSGAALHGAFELAQQLDVNDLVVAILPDGGRGYLSRFYDDEWMQKYGFAVDSEIDVSIETALETVIVVSPEMTIGDVQKLIDATAVKLVVVAERNLDDVRVGEISGVITVDSLTSLVYSDEEVATAAIKTKAVPPASFSGVNDDPENVEALLAVHGWVLLLDEGKLVGSVCRD